jgi:hypothetical protein
VRSYPSHEIFRENRFGRLLLPSAVVAFGFLIRLYACLNTYIVNPDGPLYIHQARAIYFHQWGQLTSCAMSYVSPYPFFIAAAYAAFGNWVTAARATSLIFSTMALVPMYLLLRTLFERHISLISLLLFAMIPMLVDASADVIKEPVSWFFLGFGLYFFVKNLGETRGVYVALSSTCFLAAAAARIEVLLFLMVSFVYLFFAAKRNRFVMLACFLTPVVFFLVSATAALKGLGFTAGSTLRLREVLEKPAAVLGGYTSLRQSLSVLMHQPVMGPVELFLERARNLVWFIALGTVASYVIRTFFYLFFLPFVFGLSGITKKVRTDSRVAYLMLLSCSALILLYFHLLQTWVIGNRFIVLFIFPSFICVAYGMEKLLSFSARRLPFKRRWAISLLCLAIVAFALPRDLRSRELDKVVFRQIGELIAHREGNAHVTNVASSLHLLRWLSFYSNLDYRGAPCPQPYSDFSALVGKDYDGFVQRLKREKVKYFVWEEKRWPPGTFNFEKEAGPDHFEALGSWSHPDSGRIVLYRVN